ncbi:EscU/YscU/HrcU family type III secretion system export apparatus switch protein [Deferribacterales bacterium Es71-Z0220]|jgi:flagellar biosynthesis protein|uniref:EscU/YscU/HrcU family type III secretion system export apparatus switch protein n=1 Tax=Deferrivibrio essentukiensis TaxID=2880922 RepID=UPI001F61F3C8|nr:EscU/YscU/HrcU family type III secretion system export apparatus switch protein [Deferrivibrio essentukiensis]MBZ4642949.1 type secretion exporter [Deferribacteraceae bacterium]MCB4203512.1 EscU/YscU/HrcU family type III secretion system export apparatus switch protein [Deferrivibrio essentukiensis]
MKFTRKKATALKYDPEKNKAPVVTAKGQGYVAEEILKRAREHGIEIKEDPNLVEALSKIEIYTEIPEELYKAVALILSEVYKINEKFRRKV